MQWITKIEIEHFRSINKLTIDNLSDVNIFSGLNDVGKSNVIKALNLFFNNQVDWEAPLRFLRDTNTFHSHFATNGHSKRNITIKLTFRPQKGRYKSLPEEFWVKKEWDKDNPTVPIESWGKGGTTRETTNWPNGLHFFLRRCFFFYVPAIRDQDYLKYLLGRFSEAIMEDESDDELANASVGLSHAIENRSNDLRVILKNITGLQFNFELPKSMLTLLEAAGLVTEGNIPLQMRGDGIQGLTVPGILEYLSGRSDSAFYFWGFEEPENSLEYIKATELAEQLANRYSDRSQIFLSTHSPAFLAIQNKNTTIYRVSKKLETYHKTQHSESVTEVRPVYVQGNPHLERLLPEELGLFEVMRKVDEDYREYEAHKAETQVIIEEYKKIMTPLLIVEGVHDKDTLTICWQRLYKSEMPFEIDVAGNAKTITSIVQGLGYNPIRKVCALYDHDLEGDKAIQFLDRDTRFRKDMRVRDYRKYKCKDKMLAITLPIPNISERDKQAANLNMPLEFYFPDDVLENLHAKPGCEIFSTTKLITKGESQTLDSDSIDILLKTGTKTIIHRQIVEPGKSQLIHELANLDNDKFEAFDPLFRMIVNHLVPDFELERKHIEEDS